MIRRRPLGVRVYLVAAMMLLAIVSVAVSAVVINRGVDTELREFSQRDLRFSATNAAEMAASAYLEVGGWSERRAAEGHQRADGVSGSGRKPTKDERRAYSLAPLILRVVR